MGTFRHHIFSLIPECPGAREKKQSTARSVHKAIHGRGSLCVFNHERTPFDPKKSKLTQYEVAYLEHYFELTDRAMELRTNMMQYYFAGTQAHKKQLAAYITEIEKVIDGFAFVRAPTKDLKDIENLTALAIGEQRDFFRAWSSANGRDFLKLRKTYNQHELIQSSHLKLQSAYTQLMLIFPHEDDYNQKAFYNHLCALDFI